MFDILAAIWCLIGVIVGIMVLFLFLVAAVAWIAELANQCAEKYGRK